MKGTKALVGVFTYMDDAISAVKLAKDSQLDFKVYSPVPNHELEHATYPERSPLRFITGTGAVTGLCAGFALAILCSMDWPMRVSAKDIVSIPAFIVIGYEWTILFGALFTLKGLLVLGRIPNPFKKVGFDPRFTQDKFGVVIGCENDDVDTLKQKLEKCGADEVLVKEGL